MPTRRTAVRLLLSVLAAGSASAEGSAAAFSAQGYTWANGPGEPIPYQLHAAGSADVTDGSDLAVVRRAFQTWREVACSFLTFEEVPWSSPSGLPVENDGGNRIFWVEQENAWPGERGTLALTFTFYTMDDRRIVDADMAMNGAHWTWTTVDAEIGQGTPGKVDIETVVFHEIGHFFGLAHSQDPRAAMYPSNNKLKQREPADDDVQGICTLYPNGQPVPGTPSGTGGPVGAPCRIGTDCASSLCVEDGIIGRSYCSAQCNPQQGGEPSCPLGFVCEQTSHGALCLAPAPVDELCDHCSSGEQCASGLCINVPGRNYNRAFCSQVCDPTPGQTSTCPPSFRCEVSQQGGTTLAACVPVTGVCDPQGKGGHDEPCYANGTCKAGHHCVEYYPNSGLHFCYAACDVRAIGQSCGLPRSVCGPIEGVNGLAACFTIAQENQPCIPEVCQRGAFCAWDDNAGIQSANCYRMCFDGPDQCQANHQCLGFTGLPPLCVPNEGFKLDGEPCRSDAECETGVCRPFGNHQLCTRQCATTNPDDCKPGHRCIAAVGQTQGLCWPNAFAERDSPDPSRSVREQPAGYCACDTTHACDRDCPCDPECGGSGCGCRQVDARGSAAREGAFFALLLLSVTIARRRRPEDRRGRCGAP